MQNNLPPARQYMGLYSVKELAEVFGFSRTCIDRAIKQGELAYVSPNNKTKYVYIEDFAEFMQKKGNRTTFQNVAIALNSDKTN